MSALRFGLKCSRTGVYAALLNLIDALILNAIYNFETASESCFKRLVTNDQLPLQLRDYVYYFSLLAAGFALQNSI